jgi:hypothetical protein
LLQSGARTGYAKLKPTIVAAKKKVGDNIKMSCEENVDETSASTTAAHLHQNGKKEKLKKKQQVRQRTQSFLFVSLVREAHP